MKTDATHSKSDSHVPIDKTINHITAQINATCTHSTWFSHRVWVNKVQHNNYILDPYHVSFKIRWNPFPFAMTRSFINQLQEKLHRYTTPASITFSVSWGEPWKLVRGVSAACPFLNSLQHFQRQFSSLRLAPRLLWTYLPRESGLNCIFLFPTD